MISAIKQWFKDIYADLKLGGSYEASMQVLAVGSITLPIYGIVRHHQTFTTEVWVLAILMIVFYVWMFIVYERQRRRIRARDTK